MNFGKFSVFISSNVASVPFFPSIPSAVPIKCLSYLLIISSSVISIFLPLCTLVWKVFCFFLFFLCILSRFSQSNLIFSCLFCPWFILGTSDAGNWALQMQGIESFIRLSSGYTECPQYGKKLLILFYLNY